MRTRTTTQPTVRRDRGDQHSARRAAAARAEQRTREAGGPQDLAVYSCECGSVFAGDVSTHVACPKCGTDQAW
jgi:rubrerythrin